MDHKALREHLKLKTHILSITRMREAEEGTNTKIRCTLGELNRVFQEGERLVFTPETILCGGGQVGFGFSDGLPATPGGFGFFISEGRGEGFPKGERLKCNPAVGEEMILCQPRKVMEGYSAIEVKSYEAGDRPDTVAFLVEPDQLAALISLYGFRDSGYENVIAPMVSGCASLFRLPFGELERQEPRAVIGNVDVLARSLFAKNTFFFTVPGPALERMLEDADRCFFHAPTWNGVKKRLE